MGESNWEVARDWIRAEIAAATWVPGDRLPTEQDLQARIGVGRHSLRRAVAALAAEGTLSVEQGRGTFVAACRRFHVQIGAPILPQLLAQGASAGDGTTSDEMVEVRTGHAAGAEAGLFGEGRALKQVLRLYRADGRGLCLQICHAPLADTATSVPNARETAAEVIRDHMPEDPAAVTLLTLRARLATKGEARLLEQPANQPVLVVHYLVRDATGAALARLEETWAAGRVVFDWGYGGASGLDRVETVPRTGSALDAG